MWIVCGLGNPGPKYAATRHNLGFLVLDRLLHRAPGGRWEGDPFGLAARLRYADAPLVLCKPMTFMNRSGAAVLDVLVRHGASPAQLVVVHDDLDLPLGVVRVKSGGGHGGHNGLRSVIEALGDASFARVRLGIGRPPDGDAVSHVLAPFAPEEATRVPEAVATAAAAVLCLVGEGFSRAANQYNARQRLPPAPDGQGEGSPEAQ